VVSPEPTQSAEMLEQDTVDIAVEEGRFTTLVTVLEAANLVDTLKSQESFTIFALLRKLSPGYPKELWKA
jgi:uncharacterized surface protein with fasciclin (FAS1) repeats